MKEQENAVARDPFAEYRREADPSKREKSYAWNTAIGLQRVDGLETSEYLIRTAVKNIEGEITITEAQELIRTYYETDRKKNAEPRTEEADIVSSRITEILSEKGFTFLPRSTCRSTHGCSTGSSGTPERSGTTTSQRKTGCSTATP